MNVDPKVKELKKKTDRFIDWYIAQQQREAVQSEAERKKIVSEVKQKSGE
tara:strand:- start:286 stop:435 length:150 start_codon:yes stop_codon:yes gene_type:complete